MSDDLATLGRYSGPATLILSSLAGGAKHGYALMQDVEAFADVTLRPGTLYGALSRLEAMGFIEALEGDGRRRPYRLTPAGAGALHAQLAAQRQVADVGLRRLSTAGAMR
ncbi:MAG TPA: PadR family transcriptional regulator [Solirubrobacteraceae bacterium]|jgi:DNA-binding PadR family transcriptional regulator|nr:PadR family transcriptional regulator [Solirubrobacteraceae bacterium]